MERDMSTRLAISKLNTQKLSLQEYRFALRERRVGGLTADNLSLPSGPVLSSLAANKLNEAVINGSFDQAMIMGGLAPTAPQLEAMSQASNEAVGVKSQTPREKMTDVLVKENAYRRRIQRMRHIGQKPLFTDRAALFAYHVDRWMIQDPVARRRWPITAAKLGIAGAGAGEVYDQYNYVVNNLEDSTRAIGAAADQAGQAVESAGNLRPLLPVSPQVDFSHVPIWSYPSQLVKLFEELYTKLGMYPSEIGDYFSKIGGHNANAINDMGDSLAHIGNAINGLGSLMLWSAAVTMLVIWLKPLKLNADTTAELLPAGVKGIVDMITTGIKALAIDVDPNLELEESHRRSQTSLEASSVTVASVTPHTSQIEDQHNKR